MDNVYVIYECSGDYEMYHENPLGFTLDENEAKEYVDKRNAYYEKLERLFNVDVDLNEFRNKIWEWEDKAEKITDDIFNTSPIPGFKDDRVVSGTEYAKWTTEYLIPLMESKRLEYFISNEEAQKYLPKSYTWKEFLKMYDDHEDYLQYQYDFRYESINKLN